MSRESLDSTARVYITSMNLSLYTRYFNFIPAMTYSCMRVQTFGRKRRGKGQDLSKHRVPEVVEKRLTQRPRSGAQDMTEKPRRKTDRREDQKEKRISMDNGQRTSR